MQSNINHTIRARMALGVLSTCALAGHALAGPVWELDYTDDAGELAGSAQVITSSLAPMINIYGRLSTGFVTSDFVDMYQIEITAPTMVSISTAGSGGGSSTFDSQLFIFKRKGNGNNVRALAMRANNDASSADHGSRIGDENDPNTDYTVLSRGFYYLAITGVGTTAVGNSGVIWSDLSTPGLTVSGNEHALTGWSGQGEVGEYHIRLLAVGGGAAPAPGAIALLGLAGLIKRRRR